MRTLKFYVDVKIEEDQSLAQKKQKEIGPAEASHQPNPDECQPGQTESEKDKYLKGKLKNIASEFKNILGMESARGGKTEDEKQDKKSPSSDEEVGDNNPEDKDPFEDFPPNIDVLKHYLREFKNHSEGERARSSIFDVVTENTDHLDNDEVERIT